MARFRGWLCSSARTNALPDTWRPLKSWKAKFQLADSSSLDNSSRDLGRNGVPSSSALVRVVKTAQPQAATAPRFGSDLERLIVFFAHSRVGP